MTVHEYSYCTCDICGRCIKDNIFGGGRYKLSKWHPIGAPKIHFEKDICKGCAEKMFEYVEGVR